MNVSKLQSPPQAQLHSFSNQASDKDADFLALRLLNRRSRLRLSPKPIQLDPFPGKARLFAIANSSGWFAAAITNPDDSHALILSPLSQLRSTFLSISSTDDPLSIQPRTTLSLPATPHFLTFTHDDSRLLLAYSNGSLVVYDSQALFQSSSSSPLHTFPSPSGAPLQDIYPSTGDAHIVALLRHPRDPLAVELLDLHNFTSLGGWSSGHSPATNPTSVSWSPKGKQIAIGMESGDVVTFNPTDTSAVKTIVPHPPSTNGHSIISTLWLSNTEFHAIYAPAGPLSPDSEQSHFIVIVDSKASTAGNVSLTTPYLPFPGLRPPGSFLVTLRNWEPSRLLLFIADSTSSDIGLVGSLSDASPPVSWHNLTLEETSTPSVPLDSDLNETVLLGLDLDLTDTQPFRYTGASGEAIDVPPPPIMYLYASDGTLTGWHIIQTQGVAYPGMVSSSVTPTAASPSSAAALATPESAFRKSPIFPAQTALTSTSPPTAALAPASGAAFGFSAFSGASTSFGSTSFGPFGSQQQQVPKAPSPLQAPALSAPTMSVEMTSATDDGMVSDADSGFGGLSLGGGGQPRSEGGANSMFGAFGAGPQASSGSTFGGAISSSAFSTFGSGPLKPATGFGAFVNNGPSAFGGGSASGSGSGTFSAGAFSSGSSAFGSASSVFGAKSSTDAATSSSSPMTTEAKPASGFGRSDFGAAPTTKPAFGQSAFGQSSFGQSSFGQSSFGSSAFGKSSFGTSSFGASATPSKPTTTSAFGSGATSGGFSAFASAGTTSFASALQKQPDAKPVWATGEKSQETGVLFETGAFAPKKPEETTSVTTPPAGGAFATLGQSSQSASSGSVFGKSTFGQSSFGQTVTSTSTPPKPITTTTPGGGFASFANGTSAFGAVTPANKDTRPVWATPSSDKSSIEEKPKPAFGITSTTVTTTPSVPQKESTPTATVGPTVTPEKARPAVSTPPVTPLAMQPDTSAATTTPAATPAAPSGGAFSGLATSTNAFSKLQPGFGAFGSTTPTTSPFFQKPGAATTPAFGQTSFGTPTTTPPSKEGVKAAGITTPTFGKTTFGAPSFGSTGFFGKPATSPSPFGQPSEKASSAAATETSVAPKVTEVKSAFSAFSGGASPFGAVAASSGGKSFGALLRQKEDEEVKEEEEEKRPRGFSRTAEEWTRPVSVFAQLKETAPAKGAETAEENTEGVEEEGAEETSFRSQEGGSETGYDGIDEFLKSDEEELPSEGEEEEEEVEEEEEEEEAEEVEDEELEEKSGVEVQTPPESPAAKQAGLSKPPSSVFGVTFTPPSPAKSKEAEPPKSIFIRAGSTTPPGTPAEKASPAGQPSVPPSARATTAPQAAVPASVLSPGGLLGVGRPSTRPARSSPLASRPISGEDEDHEEEEEEPLSPLDAKKARSVSPVTAVPTAESVSRPKTPPALFGTPVAPPQAAPFTLTPPVFPSVTPVKSPSPVAGKAAEPTRPATPPSVSIVGPAAPAAKSIFGGPSVFTPPAVPTGGVFVQKPVAPVTPLQAPKQLFWGAPPPVISPPVPAPASRPQSPSLAESMSAEFGNLYTALSKELEDLKSLATQASSLTVQLGKPGSGTRTAEDLSQPAKWVLSDLAQFKHIMTDVDREIQKWEKEKATCIDRMRELESDMLKGSTRKEEIERFSKASKDTDFARMLKQRMLNPDHLETQAQLRRDVRMIRGRIQQLEEYIQASKKKLNSVKSGKPTFKPPSLDTINRTYRNIDTAIEQEEVDVMSLTARVAKLELSSTAKPLLSFSASTRDKRLPDRNTDQRVGREVTPNVAASTAAALNAERTAQKLKRALLKARTEPLLNAKAVDLVPPERERTTTRKPLLAPDSGIGVGAAFAAGLNGGFSANPGVASNTVKAEATFTPLQWSAPPGWSLPPFDFGESGGSPLAGLGASRQRGAREKQHAKPIQLHAGDNKPPPPPPPAGFSWGPVPTIQPKTTISIFSDPKGKAKEEDNGGLGGSWVADGFGVGTLKK